MGMPKSLLKPSFRPGQYLAFLHLEPLIDGKQIQLVGEVDHRRKQGFLDGAAALLFPIDWPEPFGLVMIEAMACGSASPHTSNFEVLGLSGFQAGNFEIGKHEVMKRQQGLSFQSHIHDVR
jgi:glycosyltransferase involved in cell wall biosynthesis